MKALRNLWHGWAFLAFCGVCQAAGLERLDSFIKTVRTGRSDFTQVVTAPAKEGQTARTKTSSGTFEFSRPNRFRFDYRKPFEQRIVADGQTLWLWDVDLNQITSRKQAAVLGSTPAALLASATDLGALKAEFVLSDAPDQDGLEWVLAVPRAKDSTLQSVRLGFQGPLPVTLEILDSFGQKSTISFKGLQTNAPLDAARFQFRPPAGVDVIQH